MNDDRDFEQRLQTYQLSGPADDTAEMFYRCGYEAAKVELAGPKQPQRFAGRSFWSGLASGGAACLLVLAGWQLQTGSPDAPQVVSPESPPQSPATIDRSLADVSPLDAQPDEPEEVFPRSSVRDPSTVLSPAAVRQWQPLITDIQPSVSGGGGDLESPPSLRPRRLGEVQLDEFL